MTPWDAYKLAADARIAKEEAWRLRNLRSPKGRLGCALTLALLAGAIWLMFHWLNRHQDILQPNADADARWYSSASAGRN